MSSKNVTNRALKGVPFILHVESEDGNEELSFRLVLNFNALALIEDKTGYSLLNGTIFKHLSVRVSTVMFWAAIQAHSPEFAGDAGLEAIGTMLSLRNIDSAQAAVQEAYLQAIPETQAKLIREAIAEVIEKKKQKAEGTSPKAQPPSDEVSASS